MAKLKRKLLPTVGKFDLYQNIYNNDHHCNEESAELHVDVV